MSEDLKGKDETASKPVHSQQYFQNFQRVGLVMRDPILVIHSRDLKILL